MCHVRPRYQRPHPLSQPRRPCLQHVASCNRPLSCTLHTPTGTYNWEGGSECKPCPGGARCDGGASMKAIFGNWRFNGDSTSFISCFQPDACLGAPVPEAPQTSLLDPLTNLNAELRRSYPEAVQDRNESCAPGYTTRRRLSCVQSRRYRLTAILVSPPSQVHGQPVCWLRERLRAHGAGKVPPLPQHVDQHVLLDDGSQHRSHLYGNRACGQRTSRSLTFLPHPCNLALPCLDASDCAHPTHSQDSRPRAA